MYLIFGFHKHLDYKSIVVTFSDKYQKLECNVNKKLHFVYAYLDFFPWNLGELSGERGERFHQNVKTMETR